jgi:hypothetical protein
LAAGRDHPFVAVPAVSARASGILLFESARRDLMFHFLRFDPVNKLVVA